jgi:hypothetical protein
VSKNIFDDYDPITITVGDDINVDDSDIYYTSMADADTSITIADSLWTSTFDSLNIHTDPIPPSITLGNYTLTEEKLEKLEAILNILEDDPEFSGKLRSQIAFNKLSK